MLCGTGFALALGRHRPLEFAEPKLACAIASNCRSCSRGLVAVLIFWFAMLAIAMPRNGGWPIWIVLLPWPAAICRAMARARLMGIEKPWLVPFPPMFWLFAAVFMAIT